MYIYLCMRMCVCVLFFVNIESVIKKRTQRSKEYKISPLVLGLDLT